jgi:hypothetical protein
VLVLWMPRGPVRTALKRTPCRAHGWAMIGRSLACAASHFRQFDVLQDAVGRKRWGRVILAEQTWRPADGAGRSKIDL